MSKRRVLHEDSCDCSIQTFVNLGNKINDVPSGWALNLMDIHEFIPVLRYEFEGYVLINNIISTCKVRINPRLFYSGTALKDYLRSQKEINKDRKIPLELKFNKKELDEYLIKFNRENRDYIDTKLLVGKSYSSKGWGLSKEVVSKVFPLDAYNYMFPVYIDGIPAETRLNIQTRLFYNSPELSAELKRLSEIDPKQKVDARIILNDEYLELLKSLKEDMGSDRKCVICGKFIDRDSQSSKCFECLDKELTVLKLQNILTFFNPCETFYEGDLVNLGFTKGQINVIFYKLNKYELVSKEWDDRFVLKDEQTLNNFIEQWGK